MRELVVATNEAELAKVETILTQAETNGVEGVEMIGGNAARAMEAELSCIGALCRRKPASSTATPTCARCGANWKTAAA